MRGADGAKSAFNDPTRGGNSSHDLLHDRFYSKLLSKVKAGEYCAVFAAPPCSTFSISRFFAKAKAPSPVRDRSNILGLPGLGHRQREELDTANKLVSRTCEVLDAAWRVGSQFILENPVDRGDRVRPPP